MTKFANRYWGENRSLPESKVEFFNAVTTPAPSGTGTVATIRMYGPIDSWGGFWGISTKDVGAVLDALPDSVSQIVLRINSPGGEVFEGLAILNMLRAHKATVTAVVDGLAASAASVVAAGCDDTVMSPGTQMMIHSPSVITWGDAADLRKTAEILDSIEASLIEIYQSKAGLKDWPALLAEETWLTAAEAVEMGLADRTAVIPDAGETETVGGEPLIIVPAEDVEDRARATARGINLDRAAASSSMRPVSSEPGEPNRKDDLVAYEDLTAGLRERLGVTDADVTDEQLLAALDESLAESAADVPAPVLAAKPEGTVLMDAEAYADLQSAAGEGRAARAQQITDRREAIVNAAVKDGRIKASGRDRWLALLASDEAGATAAIADLQPTVPVAEIGHQVELSAASQLAARAGWAVTSTEEN